MSDEHIARGINKNAFTLANLAGLYSQRHNVVWVEVTSATDDHKLYRKYFRDLSTCSSVVPRLVPNSWVSFSLPFVVFPRKMEISCRSQRLALLTVYPRHEQTTARGLDAAWWAFKFCPPNLSKLCHSFLCSLYFCLFPTMPAFPQ